MQERQWHVTRTGSLGLLAVLLLGACASAPTALVQPPRISLSQVQVQSLGLNSQTFLLGFDMTNPNPFPLPVESLTYGVRLDGYRFASGRTHGDFTIPAQSDSAFAIEVELDLLRTAPKLIQIVRDGAHRDIPYDLEGVLAVDVPFAPGVPFETSGTIRLFASN
jgi:LEA14-like dessication related protein